MRIIIVMTCHNRMAKTRLCIKNLSESAKRLRDVDTRIVACNDGSTDETQSVLEQCGLPIDIVMGHGNLYWAKGMALAMKRAEQFDPDFYLLVNDDVIFFESAISTMMNSFLKCGSTKTAIVGATKDDNEKYSYGGVTWDSNGLLIKRNYHQVLPSDLCPECKLANWNCILIPRALYRIVGQIDDFYEHGFADYDYSNRIVLSKCKMKIAYDYVGICNRNAKSGTYLDNNLSIKKRLDLIKKPTGYPPRSNWHYVLKFYGILAPVMFLKPYIYILFTSLGIRRKS